MGEINIHDEFGSNIYKTVIDCNLHRILEIGSWDGTGSTSCFISALSCLKSPSLTCIEIQPDRYKDLVSNTKHISWVKCINNSTISYMSFIVGDFEAVWNSKYNHIPRHNTKKETVNTWYDEDISNIKQCNIGALEIDNTFYDGVLIDGSEFTGYSEFALLKNRCNVFFLDDYYNAFKTRQVVEELNSDPNWEVIAGNKHLRNGYAIFKRKVFLS